MMRQYELVERVQKYKPDANEALLNKAYVYAMQKHGKQTRASGDPYISHPLEVAAILTDMHLDESTIAVALLHDTIEDTSATRAEIDELFGLKMGADDFITKPFSQRLLVERVKAILRRSASRETLAAGGGPAKGSPEQQARTLERGQLVMDQERHTCTWKGDPVTLTVTEFLSLQSLAQRPGVVKSRDALMDAAYDDQVYVDDRTIDSHIKRLRKKMRAVDNDFSAIETLYGIGYRYNEE